MLAKEEMPFTKYAVELEKRHYVSKKTFFLPLVCVWLYDVWKECMIIYAITVTSRRLYLTYWKIKLQQYQRCPGLLLYTCFNVKKSNNNKKATKKNPYLQLKKKCDTTCSNCDTILILHRKTAMQKIKSKLLPVDACKPFSISFVSNIL